MVGLHEAIVGLEDVVDSLHVLGGEVNVAVIDNSHLLHQQIVVNIDVLGIQVIGISSQRLKQIHIHPVFPVIDNLQLPQPAC